MVIAVRRIRSAVVVLLFCCVLVSSSGAVFASSENWVEVARFTDTRAFFGDTEVFTVNQSEWRLRWEFEEGDLRAFFFDVKLNETGQTIGSYSNSGKLNVTEGIYNITDQSGDFYLFIGTTGGYYSIIIEQNIDAVPVFSSWILLPILLGATISVVVFKKRLLTKSS